MFFNNRRETFGVDPEIQQRIDQYAAMPQQRQGGGFGDILKMLAGGVLDGVATHYGSQPGYAGAQDARAKALAALQARQNELQDYGAKKRIDQQYAKPDEPPAMVRNLEAFQNFTPDQLKDFERYQALVNPRYMTGKDGLPYQTNAGPLDPNEWEDFDPAGGGASNGTGSFPRR